MKIKTRNQSLAAFCVAASITGAPAIYAQDDVPQTKVKEAAAETVSGFFESLDERSAPAPIRATTFVGETKNSTEVQGKRAADEASIRRQLRDLDSATARKRAELQRALTEAQALDKAAQYQRAYQLQTRVASAGSSWVIGLVLNEDDGDGGVLVAELIDGKPAKKAGIKAGDRIVSCGGIRLRSASSLQKIISAAGDQELGLAIKRGDAEIEVEVTPVKVDAPQSLRLWNQQLPGVGPGQNWPPTLEYNLVPRQLPKGDQPRAFQWNVSPMVPPASKELEVLKKEIRELRKLVEQAIGGRDNGGSDRGDAADDSGGTDAGGGDG